MIDVLQNKKVTKKSSQPKTKKVG